MYIRAVCGVSVLGLVAQLDVITHRCNMTVSLSYNTNPDPNHHDDNSPGHGAARSSR